MNDLKNLILKIMETFGMSGVKAAEIMGITHETFRHKKSDSIERHSFNEKNLSDLTTYIKEKASQL